jgi:hypothetical protein
LEFVGTLTVMRILIGSVLMVVLVSATSAQQPAPSAELAKKCRALTVKAYPPVVAGSKKGDAGLERTYFAACLKKGGEPDKQ